MLNTNIECFLKQHLSESSWQIQTISAGANNQVCKVVTPENIYLLKCFAPSNSAQYKLQNEFVFTQTLFNAGIERVSKPLCYDNNLLMALYQFIEGHPIANITDWHINEATQFIIQSNSITGIKESLNIASESPDSLYGFIEIVQKRLTNLSSATVSERHVTPLTNILTQVQQRLDDLKPQTNDSWHLSIERSCVSASDFGFHNAIEEHHQVTFIDFEYAGIDTPWKLICDFYAQPAIPISLSYLPNLLELSIFSTVKEQSANFAVVFELTLLKWTLIMLNEFLPHVQARRKFSWNNSCIESMEQQLCEAQEKQLAKSAQYLSEIPTRVLSVKTKLRDM